MKTAYKLLMALIAVIALSATAAQAQITSASVGTTTATSTPYGITLYGTFANPDTVYIERNGVFVDAISFVNTPTTVVASLLPSAVTEVAGLYTVNVGDGVVLTTTFTIVAAQPDIARTSVASASTTAGVSFPVTVSVTDEFGNATNSSVAPTVQFTSATSTATFTLSNTGTGTYTTNATLTTATVYTAVAPSFAGSTSLSTSITIAPGAGASAVMLTTTPIVVTAGVTNGSITVNVYDAFGNPTVLSSLPFVSGLPSPGYPLIMTSLNQNFALVTTGVYTVNLRALEASRGSGVPPAPRTVTEWNSAVIFPNPISLISSPIQAVIGLPEANSVSPAVIQPSTSAVLFTVTGASLQILLPAPSGSFPGSTVTDPSNHEIPSVITAVSETTATVSFAPSTPGIYTINLLNPAGSTTITVFAGTLGEISNTNDSGPGSFRDAVMMASTGTTLTIPASLAGEVITLTGGPITIDKLMNIVSTSGTVFIDANGGPAFIFECGSTYTEIKGVQVFNTGGNPVAVSNCGDTRVVNTQKKQLPG